MTLEACEKCGRYDNEAFLGMCPDCPRYRMNPICPVCGEDEPKMEFVTKYDRQPGEPEGPLPVRVGGYVECRCRRCSCYWEVEPLSKPWENKGGDNG